MTVHPPVENLSSPSETLFSLLRKDFQTLAAFHADWPERVSRYVIEAGDESVLEEIVTELKQAQQNSRFTGKVPETQRKALADIWWSEPRREFFRTTNITDTPFYHRLARYLNASVWYVGTYEGERYPAENFQVFLDMLHCGGDCGVPMQNVVEMFTQAGFPSDHLARQIFNTTCRLPRYEICCTLPGFGEYAATQKEIVCHSLLDPNGLTLRILSEKKFPVGPFAETLVELAFHSAKKTRAPAAALLKTCSEQAIPLVEQRILMAKKNDERLIGLQLLSEMAGADAIPFFEKALELDSMVKVRLTIQEILQSLNPSPGTDLPSLPPVPPIAALVPLPPESATILEEMTREGVSVYNRSARNRYERDLEWYEQRKSQSFIQPPEEPVYYTFEDLNFENHLKLLSTGTALECDEVKPRIYCATPRFDRLLEKFVEHPGTHLIHVARLLILWGRTPAQHRGIFSWQVAQVEYLDLYRNSHHPPFSLRDLAAVLTALEVDTNALGNRILDHETGWEKRGLFRFEPVAVWPYFAERPHLLQEALFPPTAPQSKSEANDFADRKRNALLVLATFPTIPQLFLPKLWESALGTAKGERQLAQNCLEKTAGFFEKIPPFLDDKNQETRIAAIEWLARLGCDGAIPFLKATLAKEKSDVVKGILMTALERLGASIEEFLDRAGLAKEAAAGLKKGLPAALSWFRFDQLPVVHWADTKELVDPTILHWLMVQAFKQGTPEPGPLLRRYVSCFDKTGREQLGREILAQWIAQDTIPAYTQAEAEVQAQTWVNSYSSHYSVEVQHEHFKSHMTDLLKKFKGSAIKERGLLAVAAACGGPELVTSARNFIKTYHGVRLAQSKSLVQMLAWVDEFLAIQFLLSLSGRFRTKGIREEAEIQVQLLAERKGWSVDELADRTIPTLGFDEGPVQQLSYGPREFQLQMDANFQLHLSDEAGSLLKSLPEPRQSDDEEAAKEARQAFSEAKKQLKSVVATQRERLYEAMCTQRTWKWMDWDAFLKQHPIAGYLCQRLVWTASTESGSTFTFRPLADGTLTDAQDELLTIPKDASIRLAHASTIPPASVQEWETHVQDYEVELLFRQFGQAVYQLPEAKRQDRAWLEFEGRELQASALIKRAEKLGFVRGEADYERFFSQYRKAFRGIGLEVVVNFSGTWGQVSGGVFEEHPVTISSIVFERITTGANGTSSRLKLPFLGEIPPVLLCSVWNDWNTILGIG